MFALRRRGGGIFAEDLEAAERRQLLEPLMSTRQAHRAVRTPARWRWRADDTERLAGFAHVFDAGLEHALA